MTTDGAPTPAPARAPLALDAPHLVIGICVTTIGVALTLDRLHILEASKILRFWPIGISLIGVAMVAQSIWPGADLSGGRRPRHAFGSLFFFGIVLTLALLVGQRVERRWGPSRATDEATGTVSLFSLMGGDHRVLPASPFHGGEMTSIMGGNELDLRRATIAPGEEAVIDVFTLMGGAVIRVPAGWTVDVRTTPLMGGVADQRVRDRTAPPSEGPAPRIVLRGMVLMGGLIIKS